MSMYGMIIISIHPEYKDLLGNSYAKGKILQPNKQTYLGSHLGLEGKEKSSLCLTCQLGLP